MKPRISIITLAVADLERSLLFYRDGLGLPTQGIQEGYDDHVLFELENDLSLVIFLRTELTKITGQTNGVHGSTEFILSHPAESKEEVDAILTKAVAAGGTLLAATKEESWGYYGYFKDPDGHHWEIVWNSDLE
jgi:predicted lactoylglutathione lyase